MKKLKFFLSTSLNYKNAKCIHARFFHSIKEKKEIFLLWFLPQSAVINFAERNMNLPTEITFLYRLRILWSFILFLYIFVTQWSLWVFQVLLKNLLYFKIRSICFYFQPRLWIRWSKLNRRKIINERNKFINIWHLVQF